MLYIHAVLYIHVVLHIHADLMQQLHFTQARQLKTLLLSMSPLKPEPLSVPRADYKPDSATVRSADELGQLPPVGTSDSAANAFAVTSVTDIARKQAHQQAQVTAIVKHTSMTSALRGLLKTQLQLRSPLQRGASRRKSDIPPLDAG